jgi:hypothetical protein
VRSRRTGRDVSARPIETGDKTVADRIAGAQEDDGNGGGRRLGREGRKVARGARSRLGWRSAERRSTVTFRPSTWPISSEALAECRDPRRHRLGRGATKKSDHGRHRLLRARDPRPGRRRGTKEPDELVPLHHEQSLTHAVRSQIEAAPV